MGEGCGVYSDDCLSDGQVMTSLPEAVSERPNHSSSLITIHIFAPMYPVYTVPA